MTLSYWGGRATQAQMYATALASTADWNDTRFKRPDFDQLLMKARGELDQDKRKSLFHDMAMLVRDEGGTIVPFFNQFIDAAATSKIDGWVANPQGEMMDGYALGACWLKA